MEMTWNWYIDISVSDYFRSKIQIKFSHFEKQETLDVKQLSIFPWEMTSVINYLHFLSVITYQLDVLVQILLQAVITFLTPLESSTTAANSARKSTTSRALETWYCTVVSSDIVTYILIQTSAGL